MNDGKAFTRLLQQRKRIEDCIEMSILPHRGSSRLGLVVSSKFLARAVDRNLFKRVAREAFRECRAAMPSGDILIRLRQSLKNEPRNQWKIRVAVAVKRLMAAVSA